MSGSGEILGDIAQGALTARALEPAHGESADGHCHEQACLNCGTALIGSYCHGCGQAAHVHKTLGAFFHDLLHGVFHFEGKIWRTVPLLAWKPGELTREYIDGRRASYVSPIALFLFATFLMFATVKQFGLDLSNSATVEVNGKKLRGLEANRAEVVRLQHERAALVARHQPTDQIDAVITGREEGIRVMEQLRDPTRAAQRGDKSGLASSDVPWIDRILRPIRENPQLAIYKLQSGAYKFAWLLIPISVPFVWLLFAWRRRFGLYDHTVFVTYSLCFMMLLVSVLTLGTAAGLPGMGLAFTLIPPFHMFRQLRGAYALGPVSCLWRTAALLLIAQAALVAFAAFLLAETGA